jgi:hypothetical protein
MALAPGAGARGRIPTADPDDVRAAESGDPLDNPAPLVMLTAA